MAREKQVPTEEVKPPPEAPMWPPRSVEEMVPLDEWPAVPTELAADVEAEAERPKKAGKKRAAPKKRAKKNT